MGRERDGAVMARYGEIGIPTYITDMLGSD